MAVESRKVINSMFWKLLERFSSQLVSFVISIILARILAPSDFGIIAIILVFISFANVIIDGGLNTALIQKKNAEQEDFSTIFWFCLLMASCLYVFLFVAAPFIAHFYDNEVLTPVLRVLGISILFNSANSIQYAYVSRKLLFRKLFYVNATALLISGIIGVVMAYTGFGVWALVTQSLLNAIICCVIMWITISWRPSFVFSVERFKRLFNYGWKILATNFIISVFENIRSLVIGKLYLPSTLAFFDRGKLLPNLVMTNITTTFEAVLLPAFSEEQDDSVRVKQMMRRSISVSYLFVAPLLVGLFVTAKFVVILLLTDKWLPAVSFIQIFCVAFLLMPIQSINSTSIKSLGYSDITLKLETIKKIVEVVILVVSFMINVYAVAWGIVVYNFVCLFINLYPAQKLLGYSIKDQIHDVLPILISSLVMGCVIYACLLLPLNENVIFVIQIFVGGIIYYFLCRSYANDSLEYVTNYISSLRNI